VDLVQGNPTEVKVVLASVATALAAYQVVLAAIGYRKLRIIEAAPALLGPTSQAELDAPEERLEERLEQQEERREEDR
jgi:hypothetical protein